MLNFDFYNPTRIIFGANTIPRIHDYVPTHAKVLILFGGESARKNGTLDEVRSALGEREVHEFGGIEPNPSYETLMQAVALIREHNIDYLMAVGGGSVIDGTKFIAAAVNYAGDEWEILETFGAKIIQALPYASVLTLPATGSEMNNGAVITRKSTQTKLPFSSPHVFPQFSVLDPNKTNTLPTRQLANGVVDAFIHVMEQYLTYPVNGAVQDRFAEGLLHTLIEIGPKVIEPTADYDTRANLMWTACMALNGLIGAGVPQDWSTHYIGHELTAVHGIDHARTLAIVLPANMQVRRQEKREKLLQYAERVWHIVDGDEDQRIDAAIAQTRAFFEQLGLPTRLSDYQLGMSDIDVIIQQLESHNLTQLGEHKNVSLELSRQILEASL